MFFSSAAYRSGALSSGASPIAACTELRLWAASSCNGFPHQWRVGRPMKHVQLANSTFKAYCKTRYRKRQSSVRPTCKQPSEPGREPPSLHPAAPRMMLSSSSSFRGVRMLRTLQSAHSSLRNTFVCLKRGSTLLDLRRGWQMSTATASQGSQAERGATTNSA